MIVGFLFRCWVLRKMDTSVVVVIIIIIIMIFGFFQEKCSFTAQKIVLFAIIF